MGTGGIAAGGAEVMDAFHSEFDRLGIAAELHENCASHKVGCRGFCAKDVLVDVVVDGAKTTYEFVQKKKVARIVEEHVLGGKPVEEWVAGPDYDQFHSRQTKVVLSDCGSIDPEEIDAYLAVDGYRAIQTILADMTPEEVIEEVKNSGLRGRGGGGFPTGLKWDFCSKHVADQKYVICNADEGDPGAFMDRSVIEGNPHAVIEGMAIAAYAIGATLGYVYIRAEYPLAVQRLARALEQARGKGYLGKNILDTGFDFDVRIKQGAGAFVCGEETALIASVEGKRGMPRPKPPFPASHGLWGKPTIINNVETLANLPYIFRKGAEWFASLGSEKSKGTKVFALVGKINNSGLIEVPMGISLRTIINEIGGGCPKGKALKAVQTGGPSGGCIPTSLMDTPVDYESLAQVGAIMGSGGMVVMDEDNCMVDMARYFLEFTQDESCGKCVPCRVGTKRMLEILERIVAGKGEPEDIDLLIDLGEDVKAASLCGLGQTAPNPVLSMMRYFREEYNAHIVDKRCPAGVCKPLFQYEVVDPFCKLCGICVKKCPVGAIQGGPKQLAKIIDKKCIKCGICIEACPFDAITQVDSREKVEVES
jgi:NADH-quinone oxidoreductase subunit F